MRRRARRLLVGLAVLQLWHELRLLIMAAMTPALIRRRTMIAAAVQAVIAEAAME